MIDGNQILLFDSLTKLLISKKVDKVSLKLLYLPFQVIIDNLF